MNLPTATVFAAHETVGFRQIKFQVAGIPFERGLWEVRCHSAQENAFRERPGITKMGGRLVPPQAGSHKLPPVIRFTGVGQDKVTIFCGWV